MSLTTKPDNVRKLRDHLRDETGPPLPGVGFNMSNWNRTVTTDEDCGTVCCIGGLANVIEVRENPGIGSYGDYFSPSKAQEYLGLEPLVAQWLFYPLQHLLPNRVNELDFWAAITRAQAAGALDVILTSEDPEELNKYWWGFMPC